MKKMLMLLVCLVIPVNCFAVQRYNYMSGEWETTSRNAKLRYNMHDQSYSYQPDNAKLEYNMHNSKYEWNSEADDDDYGY